MFLFLLQHFDAALFVFLVINHPGYVRFSVSVCLNIVIDYYRKILETLLADLLGKNFTNT
ncbi:hypothetical protein [Desulfosporosinus sp. FKA]|uniref:hypothetical protein n=1 Tax=Desulfosporosinus sp. FKA TaxID=1969834 RepID=UPI001124E752|nr:hypothetical protein [Desulfosporosinus sp. FKA]